MDKTQIRKQMREKRNRLSSDEIITKSNQIFQQIEEFNAFSLVNDILIYVSYKSEVYTHEFIKRCLFLHKNVFVPKVYGRTMQFIQIEHMEDLKKGAYGIFEPVKDAPIWDDIYLKDNVLLKKDASLEENVISKKNRQQKAIMILPALAVDMQFNRVGYGGGYYDRYLAVHSNMIKIAAVFDFQVMHRFETEENDKKVDIIVTEKSLQGGV